MKQVRKCLRCGDTFPESVCYQVEADIMTSSFVGEIFSKKLEGHICASCNLDMGFRTNSEKYVRAASQKGIPPQDIEAKLGAQEAWKKTSTPKSKK